MNDIVFTNKYLHPYGYTQYRYPSNKNSVNIDFLSMIKDSCIYIIDTLPRKDIKINYESLMKINKQLIKKINSDPLITFNCEIKGKNTPWMHFAWEQIPIYKY
jgi:hypothetical protein